MEEMLKTPRLSFAKYKEVVDIPPLIAIQEDSYEWFLQQHVDSNKRKPQGLQQVFSETFPIADFNNRVVLEFIGYTLGETKYTEEECRDRDVTYGVPLRVKLHLINRQSGEIREQEIFMRDMPLMTKRGTFIINGAERVIVSQLHRSPGILFSYDSQEKLYSCRLIPYRGAWVEFEIDSNNVINVRLGRKRKLPATILLKAMGYSATGEIIKLFYPDIKSLPVDEKLLEMRLVEQLKFGSIVFPIGTKLERLSKLYIANNFYSFIKNYGTTTTVVGALPKLTTNKTIIQLLNQNGYVLDSYGYTTIPQKNESITFVSNGLNDKINKSWKIINE